MLKMGCTGQINHIKGLNVLYFTNGSTDLNGSIGLIYLDGFRKNTYIYM